MLFITRIPTHYNDGTSVTQEVLGEITNQAFDLFGGWTLERPGSGGWGDEQGRVYTEESHRLEIDCKRDRYPDARAFVIAIGQRLGQKAMYFEVRYFDGVEYLEVPPPASGRKGTRKR